MDFKKIIVNITLATLFIATLGFMQTLQAAEFSADMETKSRGRLVAQGKIFFKGDLSRQEMNQGGRQIIMISRPDKNLAWTLMVQEKSYLEMAVNHEDEGMTPGNWNQKLEKGAKKIGSETVNGVKCNKYELSEDGEKVTYWISQKEGLPVRVVASDTEVNYRNIRSGHQPDKLFQIPAGYRKMVMPNIPGMPGMGNMQGMPGGR